jgi:hypothetical protein
VNPAHATKGARRSAYIGSALTQGPLRQTMLGAFLVFAGAMTYAVYLVAGARMIQKLGSVRFTACFNRCDTVRYRDVFRDA